MAAELLDGKRIAQEIQAETRDSVSRFIADGHAAPMLAAVLVGDDAASQVYVRNKEQACHRVGIQSQLHRLPSASSTHEVVGLVQRLNHDAKVSGILVQLPLPRHIDTQAVLDAVDASKDVDAFHPHNVGLISQGRPRFLPCTPHGVLQLLKRYQLKTSGRQICIIGRSDIVGKPMLLMLAQKDIGLGADYANATVTLCHSRTKDLAAVVREADIVIAAMGSPEFVTASMLKPGAIVVDVGINRTAKGLVGDVDFNSASQVASYLTPVPGGVGPLTVTMLLENTLTAARQQVGQLVRA
jgi:methylenetetrahydrofolate dehydrogenase (NADP+)/methenyltetrahydrofolate cyclohydrolase